MAFIPANKVYTFFNKNFSLKKTSAGWYAYDCPICNEGRDRKKMAVHFVYGVVKCWICGYQKYVTEFVSDIEGVTYKEAKEVLVNCKAADINFDLGHLKSDNSGKTIKTAESLPYGYNSIMEGDGVMGQRARKYLQDRGFDLKRMDSMGFGYCNRKPPTEKDENYFGYIMIPFKSKGRLVYYLGRDFIGNFLRYKNPDKNKFSVGKGDVFFNEDAMDLYDEVFVLEGWSDAYTIGDNAMASLGWKLSNTQKSKLIKSQVDIVTLVPDAGFDGQGVSFYVRALHLSLELMKYKQVKVVDPSGFVGGKDVNEIGRKAFFSEYEKCEILDEREVTLKILQD